MPVFIKKIQSLCFAIGKQSMKQKKYYVLGTAAILTCTLLAFGCGKKDMPKPQNESEMFQWKSAVASFHAGCLNISAELSGNVGNIDGILLQVQPLPSDDSCLGCPFLPEEEQDYDYDDIVLPGTGNYIAMNFCPNTKAKAYQWRLIGRNVIRTFPYMSTSVELVVPEKSAADQGFTPFIIQK